MAPDVSVILVSYNAVELLDRCIQSVHDQRDVSTEIILVDNASTDGTADHVREHHPDVTLVEVDDNRGFAAGNNAGFAVATGTYWLLLNTDAFLEPGSLAAMKAVLDMNGDVGQVGPRMLNDDRTLQRSARAFPTTWRLATEYLYLRRALPKTDAFNKFYEGAFDYDSERDMDFLQGACLLVRAAAVDDVGAMDESYFMYSEETDWARRFHDAGWRVLFSPDAECVHLGGGSAKKQWQRMYNHQVENHVRFLALHDGDRAANRARRLLSWSLGLRATAYRAGGLLRRGQAGADMRDRSEQFALARRHLKAHTGQRYEPQIPSLPARDQQA